MKVTAAPQEKQILKCLSHLQMPIIRRLGSIAGMSGVVAICLSSLLADFLTEQKIFSNTPAPFSQVFFPISLVVFYFLTHRFLNSCLPVSYFYPEGLIRRVRTYTIDSRGLHSQSAYDEGIVKWAGILKIEQAADALLFYQDKSAASIIPLSAFASTNEADAFLATAHEYWLAAQKELMQQSPPAVPGEGA